MGRGGRAGTGDPSQAEQRRKDKGKRETQKSGARSWTAQSSKVKAQGARKKKDRKQETGVRNKVKGERRKEEHRI